MHYGFFKINGVLTELIIVRVGDEIIINYGKLKFENDNYKMEIEFIDIEDEVHNQRQCTAFVGVNSVRGTYVEKH